jgi:hypothetical protein
MSPPLLRTLQTLHSLLTKLPQVPEQRKAASPRCSCGCGLVMPPNRRFVDQSHYTQWLRAGGGSAIQPKGYRVLGP